MKKRKIVSPDLWYKILRSWRLILAATLAGAVLFALLHCAVVWKQYRDISKGSKDAYDRERVAWQMGLLEKELSSEEKTEAETAAEQYGQYRATLDAMKEYINQSPLFKLDPVKVPTVSMQFRMTGGDQSQYLTNAYAALLQGAEACQQLSEVLGWTGNSDYMKDLLQVETNGDLLNVSVMASSQDRCEVMADIVERVMSYQPSAMKEAYGEFDAVKLDRSYSEQVNVGLMEKRTAYLSQWDALFSQAAGLSQNMNPTQREYYELLTQEIDREADMQNAYREIVATSSHRKVTIPAGELFSAKWMLWGLFVGLLAGMIIAVVKALVPDYLLGSHDCPGEVLGTLFVEGKKYKFLPEVDRWLFRVFYGRTADIPAAERMERIVTGIQVQAGRKRMNRLFLMGSVEDEAVERTKNNVCARLNGVTTCGKSALRSGEALKAMAMANGVVLVERVNTSRRSDILALENLCREYQLPVIGYILIR